MSTRKRKSAKQAPRPKGYSLSQVKEVVLMLYPQHPFQFDSITSAFDWDLLIGQAFDFLDKLDEAYWRRENKDAVIREARESVSALKLPLNATGCVLFNPAVKAITRQQKLQRALERFEALPLMDHFYGTTLKPLTKLWDEEIARWRENGMPLNEVIWRRSRYDEKAYHRWRIATAGTRERAKKRKPRFNKKDEPVIREVYRDKAKRNINVSDEQAKRRFRPKH
jgi:hypothetical protein